MEWLEQNIDAYRIISEILGQLRVAVREVLERNYGEEWYRKGLPQEVFDRLVAAKEREKSIDWYDDQYQEIMDYVTFPDLTEILQMNAEHFPEFIALAPSESLLNARFLELDVMRAKLGRARPISETELSFLGTFHLRFQKAVREARDKARRSAEEPSGQSQNDQEPVEAIADAGQNIDREPTEDGEVFIDFEEEESAASVQPVEAPLPPTEDDGSSPLARPVQRSVGPADSVSRSAAASSDDDRGGPVEEHAPPEDFGHSGPPDGVGPETFPDENSSGVIAPPNRATAAIGPRKLQEALSTNDHLTVLRALYREVTAIAESVWSSEVTPRAVVWERVTASDWYEMNFSRLGLEPLSAFYDVTEKVERKTRLGADKSELQEFLKEANFAKTLLALRDMFQANKI
jgi:hypothetical protein